MFRLSNPPGRVFMRSQANYVIKALINVSVSVLYVVGCIQGETGQTEDACLLRCIERFSSCAEMLDSEVLKSI